MKFHSAVRWAKPWADVEAAAAGSDMKTLCVEKDLKNGKTVMHIAAQNGHLEHARQLLAAGATANVQNGKGQTPLHMSVEYDFYFVSKLLLDSGADGEIVNEEGSKAIEGIEGSKKGTDAWDNPVNILRAAHTKEELDLGFASLEKAVETPELIDKSTLTQVGMAKNRDKDPAMKAIWDQNRFKKLVHKF